MNTPQKRAILFVLIVLGITAVTALLLVQPAQAAVDCNDSSWMVVDETELNDAITCYNAKTTVGNYTITFSQNISLTASTTTINNTVGSVALVVEGAGFSIDGQDIEGVRPFTINPDTHISIQSSTIMRGNADDSGGGIYNEGILTLSNSTLFNNSADIGGGIYNLGTLAVTNSTISGNTAAAGGGIYNINNGSITLNSTTLSGNSAAIGGGIANNATLTLSNSIIANSILGEDCDNHIILGTLIDGGHNIVEDNSCGFTGGSDPILGPLQDNGGLTFTHALLPGSPAIDAGDTILTTDQRSEPRPYGAADDIGAFEFNCSAQPWEVTNGVGLNQAIDCYNSQTTAGDYAIAFSQNISLTTSTTTISNTVNGTMLTVEGHGHTIDGQDNSGVRPFTINADTHAALQNLTITGGLATTGGGISNSGLLTLTNSTIKGNEATLSGGGIYNNSLSSTLFISQSTISDNEAGFGGGISNNGGTATMQNSTLSDNIASNNGGGIINNTGNMTLQSSTLSGNSAANGGGIFNNGNGTFNIDNSIIANSSNGGDCQNISGSINNNGHNLIEDNSCGFSGGADPILGPLQDNGGPTFTHALLPGSPAIDMGDTSFTIDQRGRSRPQGTADDIGAFESYDCIPQSWIVTNTTNLNEAIGCFNAKTTAGNYTITLSQNISLTAKTTIISNTVPGTALLVDGSGFTIDGQNNRGKRPFFINEDSTVSIQNIIITGGDMTDLGGGIHNQGNLTLNQTTITGNLSDGNGGGIYNSGTITINNSTLANNVAYIVSGGGIYNSGTITISNSTLSNNDAGVGGGNHGGGIYNTNTGTLTISNSTLSDNDAANYGGGIYNNGDLTLSYSTLSGNDADVGGGIFNFGTLTISNSTLSSNDADLGGGIHNHRDVFDFGTITISNSTLSGNSAANNGGGIHNFGDLTISNSTLSGNSAANNGGGISNNTAILTLDNTIIANSILGEDCYNDSGNINDIGHNIVADNSCGFTGGTDPMLGPLQDNGGPTFTHALLPGSPAINAGDTTLPVDQRGVERPQGPEDDIGAYEAFDCTPQAWIVANEADLNDAIACYNSKTTAGDYIITFNQNITLTASTTTIDNTVGGVTLVVEGAEFAIDGQNSDGVRPFSINPNTTVSIQNLTITGGSTTSLGGGISNSGILTVTNSTISNNNTTLSGGGVTNNLASSKIFIYHSTIRGNSAAVSGGGLLNFAGIIVTENSTISGNSASSDGGGIFNAGTFTMTNNTITDNRTGTTGGGIASASGGAYSTNVSNSIVSGNVISGTSTADDLALVLGTIDSFTSEEYNIIGTMDTNINAFNQTGDQINISDPMLGPLQDNGGATFTHALLPSSPALDAGDSFLTVDQRGIARPQGSDDDIGAVEGVQYTLTINKNGTSTGSVTSLPTGINCDPTCSTDFLISTVVTLTASADTNAEFMGWNGAGCAGIGSCVVTMDAAKSVTATFNTSYKVYLPAILK